MSDVEGDDTPVAVVPDGPMDINTAIQVPKVNLRFYMEIDTFRTVCSGVIRNLAKTNNSRIFHFKRYPQLSRIYSLISPHVRISPYVIFHLLPSICPKIIIFF